MKNQEPKNSDDMNTDEKIQERQDSVIKELQEAEQKIYDSFHPNIKILYDDVFKRRTFEVTSQLRLDFAVYVKDLFAERMSFYAKLNAICDTDQQPINFNEVIRLGGTVSPVYLMADFVCGLEEDFRNDVAEWNKIKKLCIAFGNTMYSKYDMDCDNDAIDDNTDLIMEYFGYHDMFRDLVRDFCYRVVTHHKNSQ